ncbi:N-acetyltransferase [Pontimonas sp.]|nr:N-acetyltransferase [Pontimonas sp.]
MSKGFLHPSGSIHHDAQVGEGCFVWAWSHIREGAKIGDGTSIGEAAYVGPGVVIGARCKIQNNALLYEPAVLQDGVFIGPGAVLTNDRYPRALNLDGSSKSNSDWSPVGVLVEEGASIGARAVLVGPVKVGRWSMVGAGSVVSSDVMPFSLVLGVPAAHVAWVGRAGKRLVEKDGVLTCPDSGDTFRESNGMLVMLDTE